MASLAQPVRLSPATARMVEMETVVEPAVTGSYSGFLPSFPPCCTMVGGSGVSKIGQVSSEISRCNDWRMPATIFNV